MRPGEVGQLNVANISTDGEFYYFDLRPFDARNGRVASGFTQSENQRSRTRDPNSP
jgi:hypothetical protein